MSIFIVLKLDNNKVINGDSGRSNKIQFKFKKLLVLEFFFIFLKLVFIDILIKIKADYFLKNHFLKYLI